MTDLKAKPFYLDEEAIAWVESTIESMSLDEKVGQLFVQMRKSLDEEEIKNTLANYHQGGLRWQGGTMEQVYNQNKVYQENSRIKTWGMWQGGKLLLSELTGCLIHVRIFS